MVAYWEDSGSGEKPQFALSRIPAEAESLRSKLHVSRQVAPATAPTFASCTVSPARALSGGVQIIWSGCFGKGMYKVFHGNVTDGMEM